MMISGFTFLYGEAVSIVTLHLDLDSFDGDHKALPCHHCCEIYCF